MNLEGVVREVSKRTGYVQVACEPIIKEAFKVIADELEGHGHVLVTNFGRFEVYERKKRMYIHPETGEEIYVDAKMYPKCIFSDDIKKRVL